MEKLMMDNVVEILVAVLILGGTIAFLGLRQLSRPAVTPANRVEIARGLFEYFKELEEREL